jgi:hypothetical protein
MLPSVVRKRRGGDSVRFVEGGVGHRVFGRRDLLENPKPPRFRLSVGGSRKVTLCQSSILGYCHR